MAGSQNLISSPDEGGSNFSIGGDTQSYDAMGTQLIRLYKEVETIVNRIAATVRGSTAELRTATKNFSKDNPGSGRLGLASFTRGEKAAGLGLGVVAVGSVVSSMAPNTMAAVTQAIGASTYAGFSGMTNLQATKMANMQANNGATSAMGPTMAAAGLASMGYMANTRSSQNIMGQLAGLSAMTGMSNEQAAASVGGINGMSFLRMGVRVRDNQGNLLPPNQIVNQVYNVLTRGQKLTAAQVATGFLNPGGKGYQTLSAITNGDQALMSTLQSGMLARAQKGSSITAADMGSSQQMLNVMNVDKTSPLRANFNYQTSEANKLAATSQGLVGGYNGALNTTAALNNAFTDVATAAQGVTNALMGLKGFLQTMPSAGNMGGTVGGLASLASGAATNIVSTNLMLKYLGKKGAGKAAPMMIGPRLANGAFSTAEKKVGGSIFKKFLTSGVGKALAYGLGFAGGELLDPAGGGLIADAAIMGGMSMLGGPYDHGDMGHGSTGIGGPTSTSSPVPKGTPVTSGYGQRGGGAKTKGFHPGIDYGVKTGTPIHAIADGIVSATGNGGGYGNWIEVDHGGKKSRYAHLSAILVSKGTRVKSGQVIGRSGATGNVTGPHLHLEILQNGKKVNPTPYMTGAASPSSSTNGFTATGRVNTNAHSSQSSTVLNLADSSSKDINSALDSLGNSNTADQYGSNRAHNLGNNKSMSFVGGKLRVTPGIILGTGNQRGWAKTLLARLGKPQTSANIKALTTWAAWEGGQWHNSAHYNPLNTTQPEPGAVGINKEGVRSYTSWQQGYQATVSTLNNGRYKSILAALSAGNNPGAVLKAVNHSPWGTHIPNAGGPTADLGTAVSSSLHSGTSMSTSGVGGNGAANVTVNINISKIHMQNGSPAEVRKMLTNISQQMKDSNMLRNIAVL